MKLYERFSKEEITYFDRKIVSILIEEHTNWRWLIRRLKKTHHWNVVKYLSDEHSMPIKSAYRFINYLLLSPWFKIYNADKFQKFKVSCTVRLLNRTFEYYQGLLSEYTVGHHIDLTDRNKYTNKSDNEKIDVEISFVNTDYGLFLVDQENIIWPIEILK